MSDQPPGIRGGGFKAAVESAVTSLVFRSVMTIMLGLVAYVLADVHGDVKKATTTIADIRAEVVGKLATKVEEHDRRLGKLEDRVYFPRGSQ